MPLLSKKLTSTRAVEKTLTLSDEFYRYCEFSSASLEGGNFDGVFVSCSFKDIEWYSGLFNTAILVDCKFENCTFLGTSFSGCRIVNCNFKNCRFLQDNLNAFCLASQTSLYHCQSENCEGFNELFEK
ncbi:pentapeptide repeat-containing protein [Jeongeupia naejangsanensis]|uniref:Pentapeptide repeat-containing protein n=1 Tax=Jeongeupia naejangsanensis TaxID=613195 RepID=A0ABS2BJ78_9NEIS|nr:pentapeptide repeat-containing protein [Jeongeupia naejangsanensis]